MLHGKTPVFGIAFIKYFENFRTTKVQPWNDRVQGFYKLTYIEDGIIKEI